MPITATKVTAAASQELRPSRVAIRSASEVEWCSRASRTTGKRRDVEGNNVAQVHSGGTEIPVLDEAPLFHWKAAKGFPAPGARPDEREHHESQDDHAHHPLQQVRDER